MNRLYEFSLGFGVFGGVATPILTASSSSPARPNILFIMSDDHAVHAVSAYDTRMKDGSCIAGPDWSFSFKDARIKELAAAS